MFEYSDKYVASLIKGIFDGDISEYDLPKDLYYAIADYLKKGLYKGFGKTLKQSFDTKDHELLASLRENVYQFSAAKTYQQVRDMVDKTTDADGTVIQFNEFKKEAEQIFDTYNTDYLKTEYNTCIGQAQIAVKWNDIQANKEILPFLAYSTIGDACDICAPLDGFTAPVDDPAWDSIMPLNHFNCECIVEQQDQEEGSAAETPEADRDDLVEKVTGRMDDVFKMNPGKDQIVFSPDHPYFTVPKEDKEFAATNFGLDIPKNDGNGKAAKNKIKDVKLDPMAPLFNIPAPVVNVDLGPVVVANKLHADQVTAAIKAGMNTDGVLAMIKDQGMSYTKALLEMINSIPRPEAPIVNVNQEPVITAMREMIAGQQRIMDQLNTPKEWHHDITKTKIISKQIK